MGEKGVESANHDVPLGDSSAAEVGIGRNILGADRMGAGPGSPAGSLDPNVAVAGGPIEGPHGLPDSRTPGYGPQPTRSAGAIGMSGGSDELPASVEDELQRAMDRDHRLLDELSNLSRASDETDARKVQDPPP